MIIEDRNAVERDIEATMGSYRSSSRRVPDYLLLVRDRW